MSIALERCAEMRAEMDTGRLRDEVLARAGVSADEWTLAQRTWLEKMGAELLIGRFELTNCYARAFLKRQRELEAPTGARTPTAGTLPSGTAERPLGEPVAVLPMPTALGPGVLSPAAPSMPSPWAAAPHAAPVPSAPMPAPASLAGTSMGFVAPVGPALPFARGAATTPASPGSGSLAVSPPVRRVPAELSGTSMGFVAPRGPALPFAEGASAPPPGQPAPPAAAPQPALPMARAPAALAGTSMGFVAPIGPALPFASGAPAPPPGQPATPVAASQPALPVKPAPAALAGTSMGFVAPMGPALPFAPRTPPAAAGAQSADPRSDGTQPVTPSLLEHAVLPFASVPSYASPPAPPAAASLAATAAKQAPPAPTRSRLPDTEPSARRGLVPTMPEQTTTADGGDADTEEIPLAEVERPASPPLPFAPRAAPQQPEVPPGGLTAERAEAEAPRPAVPAPAAPPPTLTLQQYASLCAELAVFRDRTEAIFHQYGLGNPRDRLFVDLGWQERLRRNPAEHQGWQVLYQRWVEHFEQKKAGGSS